MNGFNVHQTDTTWKRKLLLISTPISIESLSKIWIRCTAPSHHWGSLENHELVCRGGGGIPSSSISVRVDSILFVMELAFIHDRNSILTKIFFELVELLGSLQSGDRIPVYHQLSQIDENCCIESILDVIFLHVGLPSQSHENMEAEHLTDLLDVKLTIPKAWHGKKSTLLKMRKLVFSQDQESLRSGKLVSDPKIGSEDFSDLIISATNHKLLCQQMKWDQEKPN